MRKRIILRTHLHEDSPQCKDIYTPGTNSFTYHEFLVCADSMRKSKAVSVYFTADANAPHFRVKAPKTEIRFENEEKKNSN